jgi:hypothetical protein
MFFFARERELGQEWFLKISFGYVYIHAYILGGVECKAYVVNNFGMKIQNFLFKTQFMIRGYIFIQMAAEMKVIKKQFKQEKT